MAHFTSKATKGTCGKQGTRSYMNLLLATLVVVVCGQRSADAQVLTPLQRLARERTLPLRQQQADGLAGRDINGYDIDAGLEARAGGYTARVGTDGTRMSRTVGGVTASVSEDWSGNHHASTSIGMGRNVPLTPGGVGFRSSYSFNPSAGAASVSIGPSLGAAAGTILGEGREVSVSAPMTMSYDPRRTTNHGVNADAYEQEVYWQLFDSLSPEAQRQELDMRRRQSGAFLNELRETSSQSPVDYTPSETLTMNEQDRPQSMEPSGQQFRQSIDQSMQEFYQAAAAQRQSTAPAAQNAATPNQSQPEPDNAQTRPAQQALPVTSGSRPATQSVQPPASNSHSQTRSNGFRHWSSNGGSTRQPNFRSWTVGRPSVSNFRSWNVGQSSISASSQRRSSSRTGSSTSNTGSSRSTVQNDYLPSSQLVYRETPHTATNSNLDASPAASTSRSGVQRPASPRITPRHTGTRSNTASLSF